MYIFLFCSVCSFLAFVVKYYYHSSFVPSYCVHSITRDKTVMINIVHDVNTIQNKVYIYIYIYICKVKHGEHGIYCLIINIICSPLMTTMTALRFWLNDCLPCSTIPYFELPILLLAASPLYIFLGHIFK